MAQVFQLSGMHAHESVIHHVLACLLAAQEAACTAQKACIPPVSDLVSCP